MKWTTTALALLPWAVLSTTALAEEATTTRIAALEQELAAVKAWQDASSWTERFKINGFASVGVGSADNDGGLYGYEKELNWEADSVLGVQMTFAVNDATEATVQLQAQGADDWDPEIEWAFLAYSFDNGAKLRGGKLRVPLYMYSDYLQVGYAYPFARPNVDVYSLSPISAYSGADFILPFEFDSATLSFQGFGGEGSADISGGSLELKRIAGLVTTLEWSSLTLRGVYASALLQSADIALIDDKDGTFAGLGFNYDPGDWFLLGEFGRVEVDDAFPDTDAAYLAAGYRIDAFTPYLMVGQTETQDDDLRSGLDVFGVRSSFDAKRTTYSAGVRWDFMPGLALKADVTLADSFDGTGGDLPGNDGFANLPVVGLTPINSGSYDDTTIYSIVVDAVF